MLYGSYDVSRKLVLLLLATVAASPVQAQVQPSRGERVRITSRELPNGRSAGILERATADTVVLSGHSISRRSIDRVELNTGRKSHGLAGAGIGLIVGVGAGALIGCAVHCGEDASNDGESDLLVGVATVGGALLGTLIGGVVGGLFIHSDRWAVSSLGVISILPVVDPRGRMGLSVSLTTRVTH